MSCRDTGQAQEQTMQHAYARQQQHRDNFVCWGNVHVCTC